MKKWFIYGGLGFLGAVTFAALNGIKRAESMVKYGGANPSVVPSFLEAFVFFLSDPRKIVADSTTYEGPYSANAGKTTPATKYTPPAGLFANRK